MSKILVQKNLRFYLKKNCHLDLFLQVYLVFLTSKYSLLAHVLAKYFDSKSLQNPKFDLLNKDITFFAVISKKNNN